MASQLERENYLTSVRDFGLKFTVTGGHFNVEVSIYKNYHNKIANVPYVSLASDGGKNESLEANNKQTSKHTNKHNMRRCENLWLGPTNLFYRENVL
jgi:hypothetical protein